MLNLLSIEFINSVLYNQFMEEKKPKSKNSALVNLMLGFLCLGLAVYEYFRLTEFEATGGTISMYDIESIAYDIGGLWGVVGLWGAFSVLFFVFAIKGFKKNKK